MAEGGIDFDPTTDDSNINDDYDSLRPDEDETQDTWWERVGPRMRRLSTDVIEKIWRSRRHWEQNRAEYIPLLEQRSHEENETTYERIKNIFPDADTRKFDYDSNEDGYIFIKLKGDTNIYHELLDPSDNIIINADESKLKKLKKALGESSDEKTSRNDAQITTIQEEIDQETNRLTDENTSESDKESAREKIKELKREIETLENENEQLEEKMSLRERVRRIFKKYGLTVIGVAVAATAIITAIVEAISKRLAQVANCVGNGLKALGKKLGEILPGAIGAIVSFLLKTAGEAIGFLAKNAWLLIVAVVIFLIERVKSSK